MLGYITGQLELIQHDEAGKISRSQIKIDDPHAELYVEKVSSLDGVRLNFTADNVVFGPLHPNPAQDALPGLEEVWV